MPTSPAAHPSRRNPKTFHITLHRWQGWNRQSVLGDPHDNKNMPGTPGRGASPALTPTQHAPCQLATNSRTQPHAVGPFPTCQLPAATYRLSQGRANSKFPIHLMGECQVASPPPSPSRLQPRIPLSPPKAGCAQGPGGPRSSSPKLLAHPRSSGNDQANGFEEDFVPAAQLATQKLRINCKPSKTLGKPKINTAKEEHFPLESHGQVKSVSSGLVPRRQLRFIYCATRINVSLWLCCSLGAPFQPGRKRAHYSDIKPLVEQESRARADALPERRQQPQPHTEPLAGAQDHPPPHREEDAASGKLE